MVASEREKLRVEISCLFKNGFSRKEISLKLGAPLSTVKKVVTKYLQTGTVDRKKGSGRRRSLDAEDVKLLSGKIGENNKLTCRELRRR